MIYYNNSKKFISLIYCREAKEKEIKMIQGFGLFKEIWEHKLNEEQKNIMIQSMWVIVKKQIFGK